MKSEIEVKFLNINIDDIRERLKQAGAHLDHPMRLMRRALIEEPHHQAEHSFIRVRDEGDKTTLTFKRRDDVGASDINGTKEIEVVVSDFDDTVELLKEAGWIYKTFQESKRETWTLGRAEVVIDEWPWIEPYIEIEAETETDVKAVAKKLGFDWSNAFNGHIDGVYLRSYSFAEGFRGVIDVKEVRFKNDIPIEFIKNF